MGPYRQPWIPKGGACRCTHWLRFNGFSDGHLWRCCGCQRQNQMPVQFCQGCGHARDLLCGETDILLVSLGLAELPTHSRGPG